MKGGLATARKYGVDWCAERSSRAGNATKLKYGVEFYSHIAKMRKTKRGNKRKKATKDVDAIFRGFAI